MHFSGFAAQASSEATRDGAYVATSSMPPHEDTNGPVGVHVQDLPVENGSAADHPASHGGLPEPDGFPSQDGAQSHPQQVGSTIDMGLDGESVVPPPPPPSDGHIASQPGNHASVGMCLEHVTSRRYKKVPLTRMYNDLVKPGYAKDTVASV